MARHMGNDIAPMNVGTPAFRAWGLARYAPWQLDPPYPPPELAYEWVNLACWKAMGFCGIGSSVPLTTSPSAKISPCHITVTHTYAQQIKT